MSVRRDLLILITSLSLAACGGGGSSPTSPGSEPNPTPGDPTDTGPAPGAATDGGPSDGDTTDGASMPPPAGDDPVTELVSNLRAPRDLTFGPAGSPFEDELFVVHFAGVEATWVQKIDSGAPALQRFQNSLVGAISVDMDSRGRFYFACLTPRMGDFDGVVTVRGIDDSVTDFQYRGLDQPSGVALDARGDLYVFNRGAGTVVRIAFSDGAGPDGHSLKTIAQNLRVTDEILPNHLLVDREGRLLISETGADRVQMWVDEELVLFADSGDGLNRPVGLAQLPSGNILVGNHGDGVLIEFDPDGGVVRTFDTELGDDLLQAVAVRGDGSVYVVDDDGGRGSVYRVNFPQ